MIKHQCTLLLLFLILIPLTLSGQEPPIRDSTQTYSISKEVLQTYVGFYFFKSIGLRVEIKLEKGDLLAEVAGMGQITLVAGTSTAFRAPDIQAQLEFYNITDKAQSARLFQAGSVMEGERVAAPKTVDYEIVMVGNPSIDYELSFEPFEAEWDLLINDRKVGTATTHLRHAIYEGQLAYHGGSVIRYEAMGNKPFADIRLFAKADHRKLWARNAISQQAEITSVIKGNNEQQTEINIYNGAVQKENTVNYPNPVNGAGIYSLLAMNLKEGMTVQFPITGLNGPLWAKAQVAAKEDIRVDAMDQTFETWRIEYSSGTIKWITAKPPYLVKWQMPTGMTWQLKSVLK